MLTTPVFLGSSGSNGSLNHAPAKLSLLALKPNLVIVGMSGAPLPPTPVAEVAVEEALDIWEAEDGVRLILEEDE